MPKFAQSFCVLAEELHFGRAAARLHITQPALTHQIKMLEQEIGCVLLRRSSHQVALTEAGLVLARELQTALRQMSRAVQLALDVGQGEAGLLVVGYCELPLAGGLADVVREFSALYPGIEVSLRTLTTNQQAETLRQGGIDVGFLHPPLDGAGLRLRPAGHEGMRVVVPRDHALCQLARVTVRDLAAYRLIYCSERGAPNMHRALLAACDAAGFVPFLRQEDHSWHAMVCQAAAGLGVALVPESLANSTAPHVVFLPVVDLDLSLQTAIVTLAGVTRPVVTRFLSVCDARAAPA